VGEEGRLEVGEGVFGAEIGVVGFGDAVGDVTGRGEGNAAGFVPVIGDGVGEMKIFVSGEGVEDGEGEVPGTGDASEEFVTGVGDDKGVGVGVGVGKGVGEGVGVGHGFSRESHSFQGAESLPPNSFQSAWQRSDQRA